MNLQRGQFVAPPQLRGGDGMPAGPPPMGSPLAGGEERPLLRLNLLRALQLHRKLAVGIAAGFLVLAVAYAVKSWPVYTAQSQIYVQPVQSKVIPQGQDQSWTSNSTVYDSYIQQQVQSASNPDVLLSALHKLGPGAWQKKGETEQAAADRLGHAVEVARVGTSYEVAIAAKAKDPQLVAKIANEVAASIVERASGEGNAGDEQRIAVLREERDRIQNELNADYTEQDALNKQLGMAAVGTAAPDLIDDDIGKTREELIKAQTDHDQAEARYAAMKAGQGSSSAAIDAEADDMVAADAGLTSMKTSLNQRRAVLITQMANLTPSNPEYKQDAEELTKINASLESMMKDLRANAALRIQQKLRTDLERTAGVETQLNGQLRQLAGTAASATPKLQRASDLATDIVRLRNRYTTVDEQLHNLMLQDSVPGAVHLSVAAVAPLHPTISGILKKALPLALGGLILGLLAASVVNYLDPKVYIAADIEHALGFAPMAVLPDFDEVPDEVTAEHVLRLSSTIEHARQQGDLKNCIFTGTASGTGVTTVATRVRDVLEAMGRPTVLLDASGTPLPVPRGSGTDHPATQRGSRSTALLQKVTAESELRQESLVLTDTAPLLISAETEYLARFVDSAIVVVESGATTRAQLLAAVNALQRLGVGTVGLVLNRVKLEKADPAFRHSVRDIENHLQAQSISTQRRTVRTNPAAHEPLSETKELPSETGVGADREPAAAEPDRKPEVVGLHSSKVAGLHPTRAAQEPPVSAAIQPPSIQSSPVRPPEEETMSINDPDPWWLSEAQPQPNEVRWQPIEPRKPKEPAPATPVIERPPVQAQTIPAQSWESTSIPVASIPAVSMPAASMPAASIPTALRDRAGMEGGWTNHSSNHVSNHVSNHDSNHASNHDLNHVSNLGSRNGSSRDGAQSAPIEIRDWAKAFADRMARDKIVADGIAAETAVGVPGEIAKGTAAEMGAVVAPAAITAQHVTAEAAALEAAPIATAEVIPEKAVPEEVQQPDRDEHRYESSSRLSGLRGLLFSLGLKNLGKARGQAAEESEERLPLESEAEPTVEPTIESTIGPAILVHTFTQFAEPAPIVEAPAAAQAPAAPAGPVIAVPEFLPPKEFVPMKDREREVKTGSTARSDRRETFDELQILPSRRGQYKTRG